MLRAIKATVVEGSLVFGSTGSLGSGFIDLLSKDQKNSYSEIIKPQINFELGTRSDVYRVRTLIEKLSIKRAFYFAGHADVKNITETIARQELDNLRFCLYFLNDIHELEVFTYASSVLTELPRDYLTSLNQPDHVAKLTLYGATKRAAELLICDSLKPQSLRYIMINRYTNVFGRRPFGSESLFSYVFAEILSGNTIIRLNSSKSSLFNIVFDSEVHKKLHDYAFNPDLNDGPALRINYFVERQSLSLDDWMNRISDEIKDSRIAFRYGNMPAFWDYFPQPSPIISPDDLENYYGFKVMCKNVTTIG